MSVKRIFTLLLLLSLSFIATAQDLKPFKANYEVYRGDTFIAKSKFSLTQQNAFWVWSMTSKARGVFSLLTRKKPFAETRMEETANGLRLTQELHGDHPDKPARETTWFDHAHKTIFFTKGKKSEKLNLPDKDLYNYHSVHMLYPQLLQHPQGKLEVNFYKNSDFIAACKGN